MSITVEELSGKLLRATDKAYRIQQTLYGLARNGYSTPGEKRYAADHKRALEKLTLEQASLRAELAEAGIDVPAWLPPSSNVSDPSIPRHKVWARMDLLMQRRPVGKGEAA